MNLGIHIQKLHPTNKNNLVIRVSDETEAHKLIDTVRNNDELNSLFTVDTPKLITKRVILTRVPSSYSDDQILKFISSELSCDVSVLSLKKLSKLQSPFYTYMLCLPEIYEQSILNKGRFLLDFHTIIIKKYIKITRCFNCQCFGHVSSNCKYLTICSKCSQSHHSKDCKSDVYCCINCKSLQDTNIDTSHCADSSLCSVFQRLMKEESSTPVFIRTGLTKEQVTTTSNMATNIVDAVSLAGSSVSLPSINGLRVQMLAYLLIMLVWNNRMNSPL